MIKGIVLGDCSGSNKANDIARGIIIVVVAVLLMMFEKITLNSAKIKDNT
jgi:hypothetical protein